MGTLERLRGLRVGDRVKGISSGHPGTVVKVHDDGRVDAEKDSGHDVNWGRGMSQSSFILVAGVEEIEPKLRKGDRASKGGDTYEVIAVHGVHLWLKGADGMPYTDTMSGWEKVVPFFELGKSYHSGDRDTWQIYFQKSGQVVFQPQLIDTEKESMATTERRVAIGKMTLAGTGSHRWVVLKQYEFDNGGWKKI